jgi:hypothetical protein
MVKGRKEKGEKQQQFFTISPFSKKEYRTTGS